MKHPLTPQQIEVVLLLLSEIEKNKNVSNVQVLGSDFVNDVYVRYNKIVVENGDAAQIEKIYEVSTSGTIDKNPRVNKPFATLSERVYFFSKLYPIKIK